MGHDLEIPSRGNLIDLTTQTWVRQTGQVVNLDDDTWLDGPAGAVDIVGDEWLDRELARLGAIRHDEGGLLGNMDQLAGPGFDAAALNPKVRRFYEETSDWRLEAWSQWCPAAWPFGWLLSAVFARRLQQLSLPLRPLDVAHGMDSQVVVARNSAGEQLGAAWLRSLRSTGQRVYSGWYGLAWLPNRDRPSIRVMFPLPNGSVTVFLRPEVRHDGALVLVSPPGRFGDDGCYLIVNHATRRAAHVRRVPLHEEFAVWVDTEGTVRTDHGLSLWNIPTLRLHYKLEHRPSR